MNYLLNMDVIWFVLCMWQNLLLDLTDTPISGLSSESANYLVIRKVILQEIIHHLKM